MNSSISSSDVVTRIHRFGRLESEMTSASSRSALFEQTDYRRSLRDRLDALLGGGDRVLSLDIFDTLLMRDNSSELTRFFEIGGLMAKIVNADHDIEARRRIEDTRANNGTGSVSQVDCFLCRYLGTKASYRASKRVLGCREGSLSEIHRTASRVLTGGDRHAGKFVAAELDYESTRLNVNAFLLEYAESHRKRGGKVILITDMYMHETHVRTLLEKLGVDMSLFDYMVSSADAKISKASGRIFGKIERDLDRTPGEFVHVGDNFRGDYKQAREHGWYALHLPLADADILARRRDHLDTAERLRNDFGVRVDIAMPF